MVHAIRFLKCKNGHTLPITFDSNECGCHHKGKPYIIINCTDCLKEYTKNITGTTAKDYDLNEIIIPLDADGLKEIEQLRKRKETKK